MAGSTRYLAGAGRKTSNDRLNPEEAELDAMAEAKAKWPDSGPELRSWRPAISAGCKNCYAARMASTRLAHLPTYAGLTKARFKWTGEVRFFPEKLAEPMRRRKPTGIFVGDMGDIGLLSNERIAAIFGVMAATPQHRYYVLTKRPGRLREWFEWFERFDACREVRDILRAFVVGMVPIPYSMPARGLWVNLWPLPNVWVGTSVCTKADVDKNIPELLRSPAAVRFLSCEPLLEDLDLRCLNDGSWYDREGAQCYDALTGHAYYRDGEHGLGGGPKLDWVIAGGESGPRARPCRVEWLRSIVRQCREAGTACWVKQYGANAIGDGYDLGDEVVRELDAAGCETLHETARLPLRDRAGSGMSEWSEDLRVREMPEEPR